ncbi:MAG: hypothetical protein AAGH46_02580 [Bacteroidota bacterium]
MMKKENLNSIKKAGFKVPEGYFDDVSKSILDKINNEHKEVIPSSNGFKAPDNYFDEVESEIIAQTLSKNEAEVIPLYKRKFIYYLSGVAAAILILFSLMPLNNPNNELTIEMVETYFEESELDSYELAELLLESDLLELEDLNIEPKFDDLEIEAYLLENADLEQIIIQ